MAIIHMQLLNKGTDAWRPVEVTPLEGAVYRVEGPMPAGEEWPYPPGTLIATRWTKFPDGEHRLIPAGPAPTFRSELADHYKRMAGLAVGTLPYWAAIYSLPRTPGGPLEGLWFFLAGAAGALVSLIALMWLKPQSLTAKWALRSAVGFGIFSCLIALAF